jgi:serine/threonine-protein kinase SRPK3
LRPTRHCLQKDSILTLSLGEFLYKYLIPSNFNLPDSVLSLEGDDKELFLDFVSHMLRWLPEERKTAKELLEHPWLVI